MKARDEICAAIGNEGATQKRDAPIVFWDAFGLENPGSGVGVYGRELARALFPFKPTIIGTAAMTADFGELPSVHLECNWGFERFCTSKPVWPRRVASAMSSALSRVKTKRAVLLHGLSNINLSLRSHPKLRRVLTVHDVIPLLAPNLVSRAYTAQFKWLFPRAVVAADRIICVSPWTEASLLSRIPEARGKTIVIPNGIPRAAGHSQVKARTEGKKPKLLLVSRDEPYKRIDLFIDLVRRGRSTWDGVVVTDRKGKARLARAATDLISTGALTVLSGISKAELSNLYQSVSVYVQPSLFEGFCLPALEAFASGTPVVFTSGSALDDTFRHEKLREFAVGILPAASVDSWAEAARQAVSVGRAHSEKFAAAMAAVPDWTDSARAVMTVYNSLS